MATQTVELILQSGLTTPTIRLFLQESDGGYGDTIAAGSLGYEQTNALGTYRANYTDETAGNYKVLALVSGVPVAVYYVTLAASAGVYVAGDFTTMATVDANIVSVNGDAVTGTADDTISVIVRPSTVIRNRTPLKLVQNMAYLNSNNNLVTLYLVGAPLASATDARLTIRNTTDDSLVVNRKASYSVTSSTGVVTFELSATDTAQSAADTYKWQVDIRHSSDYQRPVGGPCIFELDLSNPIP